MVQPKSIDQDEGYRQFPEPADPLVKLCALADFEIFQPRLDGTLRRSDGLDRGWTGAGSTTGDGMARTSFRSAASRALSA